MDYSDEEKRLVRSILDKYDEDSLCIFTGDAANAFIRHAGVSAEILGEMWAVCDTQCKGFLTKEELSLFVRLLGYAQIDHDFTRPSCRQKAGPIAVLDEWPASDGVEPPATAEEEAIVAEIFREVDPDGFGILDMSAAENILLRTGLPYDTLSAAWDLVDGPPPKGFLTPVELRRFLRLVGWAQDGVLPHSGLLIRSAPLPSLDDSWIPIKPEPSSSSVPLTNATVADPFTRMPVASPAMNVEPVLPSLTEADRQKFLIIFKRAKPINGLLSGEKSKRILDKSKLPVNDLAGIWNLADSKQRGALDSTEFIVAMYFVKCLMERTISRLPSNLPTGLIAAAAVPVIHTSPSSHPPPSPPPETPLIDLDAPLPPLPTSPTSPSRITPTPTLTWHRQSQSQGQSGPIAVQPTSTRGSISSRNSMNHSRSPSNPPSRALELSQASTVFTPTGDQTQSSEHSQASSEPPPPYTAMDRESLSA